MLTIRSGNEWDRLRDVVVGSATGANWPTQDPVFARESEKTTWTHTPVPSGPVPSWIIDETNEDLAGLVTTLEQAGVNVRRPSENDFVASNGMYNYCPRDRVLIAGDTIVDVNMMYPCRDQEIFYMEFLVDHAHRYVTMPRESGVVLDAANVCRLGNDWLFLESASGSRPAYDWLCSQFPWINIELCNFYAGVHIDSTVVPLREGVVMLNADRVSEQNVPRCLQNWHKIWVEDVVAKDFYDYPYASKWIGINTLSLDPHTVIVDEQQLDLVRVLERHKFTVIPQRLRHSRTLGGGFHCVTLDLWREA